MASMCRIEWPTMHGWMQRRTKGTFRLLGDEWGAWGEGLARPRWRTADWPNPTPWARKPSAAKRFRSTVLVGSFRSAREPSILSTTLRFLGSLPKMAFGSGDAQDDADGRLTSCAA